MIAQDATEITTRMARTAWLMTVAFVMMSIKTRDPDEAGAAPSCTCSARTKEPSVCNEASEASAARRWDSADERA